MKNKSYLKDMHTNREKIDYILEYYKLHIIGVLLLLSFVSYFVYSQVTRINEIFNITVISSYYGQNQNVNLKNDLTKFLGKKVGGKDQAGVEVYPQLGGSDAMVLEQKLFAEISSNQIDLLIVDKDRFDRYCKTGAFVRIDNIPGIDVLRKNSTSKNGPYGKYGWILDDNPLFKGVNVKKDVIVGISATSKRKLEAQKVLLWLLNKK